MEGVCELVGGRVQLPLDSGLGLPEKVTRMIGSVGHDQLKSAVAGPITVRKLAAEVGG